MPKKGRAPKRYTAAQKAKILAAAKKRGLTGAQVQQRFGVSTLTFYKWRGPVRRPYKTARGGAVGNGRSGAASLREALRARVRELLPQIVQHELDRLLR